MALISISEVEALEGIIQAILECCIQKSHYKGHVEFHILNLKKEV